MLPLGYQISSKIPVKRSRSSLPELKSRCSAIHLLGTGALGARCSGVEHQTGGRETRRGNCEAPSEDRKAICIVSQALSSLYLYSMALRNMAFASSALVKSRQFPDISQGSSFLDICPKHRQDKNIFFVVRNASNRHQGLFTATVVPAAAASVTSAAWSLSTSELHVYNTLSRKKEAFTTVEPGVVRFYSCGPTVYDYAHIGNFRAFLTYDVIKRWLLFRGYEVKHVMNLTDVDDKIIKKANELGCTADELTNKYADAFFADLNLLNVVPAQHYPRATRHIKEIEETVNGLKKRGYAYEREGSTYFSVANFDSYGRLAQLEKREKGSLTAAASEGGNVDSDEYDKDDLRDFALWKGFKPEDAKVFWETSLGKGRPGWHIECTCMAMKYLGPELDLHGGGIDLVFPHHENEIAQSEALTGRPFSRFWVHNGFVNINNEKMSKSLGNFRTLRDIAKKPDDARAFRYLVVSSQYRSALAFTDQCFKSAKSTVKRLDALKKRLQNADGNGGEERISDVIVRASKDFSLAMDDDFNTPRAAAAMFSLVNASEKMLKAKEMNVHAAESVLRCLDDMDKVFGIFYTPTMPTGNSDPRPGSTAQVEVPPPHLLELLDERAEARKAKDFARADQIRDKILTEGFSIVDTPQGATLQSLDS